MTVWLKGQVSCLTCQIFRPAVWTDNLGEDKKCIFQGTPPEILFLPEKVRALTSRESHQKMGLELALALAYP